GGVGVGTERAPPRAVVGVLLDRGVDEGRPGPDRDDRLDERIGALLAQVGAVEVDDEALEVLLLRGGSAVAGRSDEAGGRPDLVEVPVQLVGELDLLPLAGGRLGAPAP